jgi:hypothetical protein
MNRAAKPSDLPRQVQIKVVKNQGVIADKCHVVVRFVDRLRGLIGKTSLERRGHVLSTVQQRAHVVHADADRRGVRAVRAELGWRATLCGFFGGRKRPAVEAVASF